MANRRKQPAPLEQAKKDLQRLFEKMADTWPGGAWQGGDVEMEEEGPGWIKVRLDERGRSGKKTRSRISMCYSESGIPLVCVQSLDGPDVHVYISPVASAVIAVILR